MCSTGHQITFCVGIYVSELWGKIFGANKSKIYTQEEFEIIKFSDINMVNISRKKLNPFIDVIRVMTLNLKTEPKKKFAV